MNIVNIRDMTLPARKTTLDTNSFQRSSALKLASRVDQIKPFQAMEILKATGQLASAGEDIVAMNIGEPDFTAPEQVKRAAIRAIERGATQYSDARGLPSLREAISQHYRDKFDIAVNPNRVVVTAGASAALLLACAALVNDGDEVLMPDPCYPCNRQFVSVFGGEPKLLPTLACNNFALNPETVDEAWNRRTAGIILSTPSNPTGCSMDGPQLATLLSVVAKRGGFAIVDEIYQGLTYDHAPTTALALDDNAIVVNSFSKYFGMTGWRLGWLIVPELLVSSIEKLAQNLYICPPTISQHAAVACFDPETLEVLEQRRLEFRRRRDYIVPALRSIGFDVPVIPDGAFYVYAKCTGVRHPSASNSVDFAHALLHQAGVAVVPGTDFGTEQANSYLRFAYSTSIENIAKAIERIQSMCA
jgi:aspartate/methionine/tyrosine aminotransferase